jgi:6-phosphogluconolactonase
VGDCSSRAFLIHKWVEISCNFRVIGTRPAGFEACSRKPHIQMEMNRRMSKRSWLLGMGALVMIGLLLACGSSYDRSADGLLLVGSQGSSVIETFSFRLDNGSVAAIANNPNDTGNETCLLNGSPSSMVIDPAGQYAYVIFNKSDQCPNATKFGIAAFQVKTDGYIAQVGNLVSDQNPVSLTMDPSGKFLFVAEGTQGLVNVYKIGSGAALTAVAGNYNFINGVGFQTPNIVAVAPTPTVLPSVGITGVQNAVCSAPGNTAPTSEFLYAVDSVNYVVWEFTVNTSTGALGNSSLSGVNKFSTDQVPLGIAVDPCDRFAYVSDSLTNKISAYTICSYVLQPSCPVADGSLVPVIGSPFALTGSANGPGPIVVDPFGNYVYAVGTLSNTVSLLKISPVSGGLTALTPATIATGQQPTSIAIRADDNWMFVTNQASANVSQYSVTPASGALAASPAIDTDNNPWGVAVK